MYNYHKESILKFVEYFKKDNSVEGIVLIGSLARKCEKAFSDIDIVMVVTESRYEQLRKGNRICEINTTLCTYENGYFDLKYFTNNILKSISKRGSEPSRYAFTDAVVLYAKGEELQKIISEIPIFQESERLEKLHSFYSAFTLAHSYYWGESKNNSYLKLRSASDIVLFGLRLLLEDARVLFPCQKALLKSIEQLPYPTADLLNAIERFTHDLTDETKTCFINLIHENLRDYTPSNEIDQIITQHVVDNEQWWLNTRPLIAEW